MIRMSLFILLFFSFAQATAAEQSPTLDVIDVGEGDAILIGEKTQGWALIDSGNLISGFRVVDYMKTRGIDSLTHLITTHPHPDHIGGVFPVLHNFRVENLYDNGEKLRATPDNDFYRRYVELFRRREGYRALKEGDILILGDIRLRILSPKSSDEFEDWNSNSLVIMLEHKSFRALLVGDANRETERALLSRHKNLKAQVLKIGHHGADDASSEEFLKAVGPKLAILSVGKEQLAQEKPSKALLSRLKKLDIKVLRTDIRGDIRVDLDD